MYHGKVCCWCACCSIIATPSNQSRTDAIEALAERLEIAPPAVGRPPLKDALGRHQPGRRREMRQAIVLHWLLAWVAEDRRGGRRGGPRAAGRGDIAESPNQGQAQTPASGRATCGRGPAWACRQRIERLQRGALKLHVEPHMLRQRRQIDEIDGLIDDELRRGNLALVAGAILDQLPVHYAFERFEVRDRFTRSLAAIDGAREVALADRLHALIEGLGTNRGWQTEDSGLIEGILTPRTTRAITEARAAVAADQGRRRMSDARCAAQLKRLDVCAVVLLRLQASRNRARRPFAQTMAIYERAWQYAMQVRSESLAVSLLLDATRYALEIGQLPTALKMANRAEFIASRQRNDRRWTQALVVRARVRARLGDDGAWFDLERAKGLYAALQLLDGPGRRPKTDWFQPGLLKLIERTREEVKAFIDVPKETPWWETGF